MSAADLTGRRVLLVEDEALVAMLAEDTLADAGCAVVVAADMAEAVRAIEAERFDAVVLDLNLRGEESYPVAAVLAGRGVPFVFTSGYGADLKAPFTGRPFVGKPYRGDELVLAVAGLVGGAATRGGT